MALSFSGQPIRIARDGFKTSETDSPIIAENCPHPHSLFKVFAGARYKFQKPVYSPGYFFAPDKTPRFVLIGTWIGCK